MGTPRRRRPRAVGALVFVILTSSSFPTEAISEKTWEGASLNVNLDGPVLDDAWRRMPDGLTRPVTSTAETAPSSSDAGEKIGRKGLSGGNFALDLTGSVDLALAAPRRIADSDGRTTSGNYEATMMTPLFRFGRGTYATSGRRSALLHGPSLHLLADYDFNKVWYGIRSFGLGMLWEGSGVASSRRSVYGRRGDAGMRSSRMLQLQQQGRIAAARTGAASKDDDDDKVKGGGAKGDTPLVPIGDSLSRCAIRLCAKRDLGTGSDFAEFELTKRLEADGEPYPPSHAPSIRLRVDGLSLETIARLGDVGTASSLLSNISSLRCDADGATLSLRAPIHRRVDLVSRSTLLLGGPKRSLLGRVPPVTAKADWSSGTWLPDVRVSTSGDVVGRSEVGFRGPMRLPRKLRVLSGVVQAVGSAFSGIFTIVGVGGDTVQGDGGRGGVHAPLPSVWDGGLGVRLTLRRRVNWSVFDLGSAPLDEDDGERGHDTAVRLQICGVDGSGRSFSSLTFEAALERPLESARMTLTHEQMVDAR